MAKPLCVDLFCGLGGWADGFLAEGYRVIGLDIEAHDYGTGGYPGELILRDARSIHGSEFKDAAVIVASPPCQAYSYRAMPWKRAKALPPPDNTLFETCFRIQREACEAAGRYIPLIVENVRGAQPWVGRAMANYGSFYLWGDVGMIGSRVVAGELRYGVTVRAVRALKQPGRNFNFPEKYGIPSPSFHGHDDEPSVRDALKTVGHLNIRDGHSHTLHLTNPAEHERGVKGFTPNGEPLEKNTLGRKHGSKSKARKAASAMIAKIPFPLAQYIARCFKPTAKSQGLKAVVNG